MLKSVPPSRQVSEEYFFKYFWLKKTKNLPFLCPLAILLQPFSLTFSLFAPPCLVSKPRMNDAILSILAYSIASNGMIIANKLILSSFQFPMNLLLLAIQVSFN
jgi:hypothetical protein